MALSRSHQLLVSLLACFLSLSVSAITFKKPVWLANVTSTNTLDGRDLGWQGKIGNCYINTFGDTFPCKDSNPQRSCNFEDLHRNSAGFADEVGTYTDIYAANDHVDREFIKYDDGIESIYTGMGITNVIEILPLVGVVYVLPGSTVQNTFKGASVALITVDPFCNASLVNTRLVPNMWYGDLSNPYNETFYGDHGAVIDPDGLFIYSYGSIPNGNGIGLARVPPLLAAVLPAYEYWNGHSWQLERIFNPTDAISVFSAGQGSIAWSKFLNRYIYFTSDFMAGVAAMTAEQPQGPWSSVSEIMWSVADNPYEFRSYQSQAIYSPAIQPKYSDTDGRYYVIYFTYAVTSPNKPGHEIINAINVTLTGL